MYTTNRPKKPKIVNARCINCKYYIKRKQICNKHKMKTTRFSSCLQFETGDK